MERRHIFSFHGKEKKKERRNGELLLTYHILTLLSTFPPISNGWKFRCTSIKLRRITFQLTIYNESSELFICFISLSKTGKKETSLRLTSSMATSINGLNCMLTRSSFTLNYRIDINRLKRSPPPLLSTNQRIIPTDDIYAGHGR